MKLTDLEEQLGNTTRMCVYGPPNSGKTLATGKLAEKFNLLWFSLENGDSVLKQLPREWRERIDLIRLRDSKVYPIAIETMLKVVKGDRCTICEPHGKVACQVCAKNPAAHKDTVHLNTLGQETVVVIDSMTQLSLSAIWNITRNQPDDYKLQLDDWGNLKVLMERFLGCIQNARYNVVCITHEEEIEMTDGTKKIVPVSGSGNTSRNTARYFDHIIYAYMLNRKHRLASSTRHSVSILAGSRDDIDISTIENGSLLDFFPQWKRSDFKLNRSEEEAVQKQEPVVATQAVEVKQEQAVVSPSAAVTQNARLAAIMAKVKGK